MSPADLVPARHRWTARRLVLACTALALLVGVPGVAVAALALRPASKTIVLPAMPTPSPKPTIPTAVGEMSALRSLVIRDGVALAVKSLADAMLAGDQAACVGAGKSAAASALLRRHFRNLRAMRVTTFRISSGAPVKGDRAGLWKIPLSIDFCFVVAGCKTMRVVEPSVWQDTAAGPILVSLSPSPNGDDWYEDPHPWELTDLHVAVGRRVLVAAPASLPGRLPSALAAAEKGAVKADLYAVGGPIDYYRVYLAGPAEWKKWFGGMKASWAAGFSTATGDYSDDVVLNSAKVSASFLPAILRHELTHAASSYGQNYWRNNWWLIEGYAENTEHGLSFDASSVTRRFVDNGWKRDLPASSPPANASLTSAAARYGVAYLAVYRLEKRFGRAALITFFNRVVRQGQSYETASTEAFKTPWPGVKSDLIRFIKAY
ncbi:MAG: hypothetical protein HOV79_04255 [Hamadaea sp.]|nr:hypothetical protein [Hamadaea sp.]